MKKAHLHLIKWGLAKGYNIAGLMSKVSLSYRGQVQGSQGC